MDSAAEINVFLDDGAMHVKVIMPQLVDPEGTPYALGAEEIAETAKSLRAALIAAGMTPSARRQGGGGWGGAKPGAKPEDPAPADLKDNIPQHCDEPMIYRPAYRSAAGKDVGAKFQCRKGADCAEAEVFNDKKYGKSMWEDRYRKDLEAEMSAA